MRAILYLADFYLADAHDAVLTAAVQMAVVPCTGEGRDSRGVVFHSDRGSEYTAATFDTACTCSGVV